MDNKRIVAGIIDIFIAAMIQSILMFILIIKPIQIHQIDSSSIILRNSIITIISMLYLIIRDNLGDKSIGKKIFRLKIINLASNEKANFSSRLLRNITWLLGPIEIIYFLLSGNRIGDRIANTKVERISRD